MEAEEPVNWDNIELNIETESRLPQTRADLPNFLPPAALLISKIGIGSDKQLFCFLCREIFFTRQDLQCHIRSAHAAETQCYICKRKFTSVVVYVSHLHIAHQCIGLQFKCTICCSPYDALWSTQSPFQYIRHMRVGHGDTTDREVVEIFAFDPIPLYVCYFCKAGFCIRENMFLHLMKIHEIEWDIVFNVAVNFRMLHSKKVHGCTKCPKTFSDSSLLRDHTKVVCQYFDQNYSEFTWCCKYCLIDQGISNGLKRPRMECSHGYCVYNECPVHLKITSDAKRCHVTCNHNNRPSVGQCNCCYANPGVNLFTCPGCEVNCPSYVLLTHHYLAKHMEHYRQHCRTMEDSVTVVDDKRTWSW